MSENVVTSLSDVEHNRPRIDNDSTHHELETYPELELVLSLAVATVANAFDLDPALQADDIQAMERAAISAMVVYYAPIAATARRVAAAADQAEAESAASTGLPPDLAATVMQRSIAVAVSERAMAEAAAIAAELEAVRAALALEAIAIDSCYRLALEAASSAARSAQAQRQISGVTSEA